MLTFKVLAALLHYPDEGTTQALDEMKAIVASERVLPRKERQAVEAFIDGLRGRDVMDVQAAYVALFDQSRGLSLHLFEHIHGESRDRGQAMVNLLEHYRAAGLDVAANELPDSLPLFLEFLSTRPLDEARQLLAEPIGVVALLRARLEKREAPHAALFRAIEALAEHRADEAAIRDTVAQEKRDDTPEALDASWEDAPVTFSGAADPAGGCNAAAAIVARFAPPKGGGG
jgi:nitrate reductase delta subunit